LDYKKAIQAIAPFPMYRLYNTKNGAYLYARGDADKAHVLNTWPEFEFTDGVPAFYASLTSQAGLTPIYRLYNTKNGMYLYTRGDADKAHVMSTWPEFEFTDGVPAFYASLTSQAGLTPIYRLYNTLNGMYLYTRSEADKVHVMSTWPEFEFTDGVPAFYAYITADSGPALYKYSGPDIPVGLWYYGKSDIQNSHFQIDANRPYNIKDSNENIIAQIDASSTTSVTYNDNGILEVSGSIASMIINSTINFDAADGDNSTIIFNVHRSNFVTSDWRGIIDQYRGKIKVQYYRGPDIYNGCDPTATSCPDVTQIWVVNTLPLELYTQGTAETSGTGNINHTKVMATSFRTYGYWYIENATKYVPMGFKIRSDGSSQFYGGYDWEIAHANITTSAKATRGMVAWYGGDIALTPYSSWSDGNTRSLTSYPWCQAVSDPYGNWYATHSSAIPAGNHMWGLIANGSVNLATNYGWDWQRIMKYYYTGISFNTLY
jgi:peptidoglycan hydrolase-like amidase